MLLLIYKVHECWQYTVTEYSGAFTQREKRLLDSSCRSVRLSACISATLTVRILAKFRIWGCLWKCVERKIGQKFWAVYAQT